MILNLTPNFEPLGKGTIEFESFLFKGGEPHIKIKTDISEGEEVLITQRINSFHEFGLMLLAIDAVQRMGVDLIKIFIPYFPAARQDRVMVPGEPLSVKVYADIINNSGVYHTTVFDAHSEVTAAVLNHCTVVPNHKFIEMVLNELGSDALLISPDGGALKKIYKVSEYLGGREVVECSKSRDVKTGKLKGFKVYADDLQGRDCLIVDDICDGGGTFMGLAKELEAKNAGRLFLAVSHGIFSKGFDELSQHFEKIYTTDSFREISEDKVKVFKLNTIIK
ncbi:ribose-phosphate diphosphokinase [Paracrocinitomix mangrovi]|uniref:ribose-phosphate diphosphokinase n=1 Tax=Paracrocinitomix mangrovi TaxID=2862509 RepID=UPI001C8E3268|nr:ribose-phosphate diphosphokinase [Paracrocinitomix mangrovi]UKN00767.1 ribose-phosphate diphosphokinase [Paracrocinitomix mangrovi]